MTTKALAKRVVWVIKSWIPYGDLWPVPRIVGGVLIVTLYRHGSALRCIGEFRVPAKNLAKMGPNKFVDFVIAALPADLEDKLLGPLPPCPKRDSCRWASSCCGRPLESHEVEQERYWLERGKREDLVLTGRRELREIYGDKLDGMLEAAGVEL